MWLDKLRELKAAVGLNNEQIASRSGIPKPTVEKIFSGATKEPKITTIQQLVHSLGYTLDDIDDSRKSASPHEMEIIKKYRALDGRGKIAVDLLLDTEYKYSRQTKTVEIFPAKEYIQSASAGYGDFSDDDSFTVVDLVKRPPAGTTYIVKVDGDSMEPTYHDGDRLFVSAQKTLRYGDIGLFSVNGDIFVKEYGKAGLVSHNDQYPIIRPVSGDTTVILGRVLGVCTRDYLQVKFHPS